MSAKRKVQLYQKRTMSPVQFLRQTCSFLFEESRKRYKLGDPKSKFFDPYLCEGWQKFKAAGFVFLAFWVEAYLNYALSAIFPKLYDILEKSSPMEKLECVCQELEIKYDKSKFKSLFDFRNDLAHGKRPETKEENNEMHLDKFQKMQENISMDSKLESRWESYLRNDEEKIIKHLECVLDKIQKNAKLEFYATGGTDYKLYSATIEGHL